MKNDFLIIAIDGGAAAGKSTLSREMASKHNLMHVDTGAHYRVIALALIQEGLTAKEPSQVQAYLTSLSINTQVNGTSAIMGFSAHQYEDADLRSDAVNSGVSAYAQLEEVRSFLKEYQRSLVGLAKEKGFEGIIMEGRDIGSVILPDAPYRFFLFADPVIRQRRRDNQGQDDAIAARDQLDSSRKHAPLKCTDGAIKIDTSEMSVAEVYQYVCELTHLPTVS